MDITFNFVHCTDGIQRAELSAETNERIYTYRLTSYGFIQPMVNYRPLDTLPTTPTTRKLSRALDKVQPQLTRMLCLYSGTEEYKNLFWEVKSILKALD